MSIITILYNHWFVDMRDCGHWFGYGALSSGVIRPCSVVRFRRALGGQPSRALVHGSQYRDHRPASQRLLHRL